VVVGGAVAVVVPGVVAVVIDVVVEAISPQNSTSRSLTVTFSPGLGRTVMTISDGRSPAAVVVSSKTTGPSRSITSYGKTTETDTVTMA